MIYIILLQLSYSQTFLILRLYLNHFFSKNHKINKKNYFSRVIPYHHIFEYITVNQMNLYYYHMNQICENKIV
jgi:hypothetical protein